MMTVQLKMNLDGTITVNLDFKVVCLALAQTAAKYTLLRDLSGEGRFHYVTLINFDVVQAIKDNVVGADELALFSVVMGLKELPQELLAKANVVGTSERQGAEVIQLHRPKE